MAKSAENLTTKVDEVVLRFLEGENEGVEIRVNPPRTLTIGRSEACDIFLAEKKISRKHCELVVSEDGVRLNDFNSTNGTFINSRKVGKEAVENNDKIRVGTSVIEVAIFRESQLDAGDDVKTGSGVQINISSSRAMEEELDGAAKSSPRPKVEVESVPAFGFPEDDSDDGPAVEKSVSAEIPMDLGASQSRAVSDSGSFSIEVPDIGEGFDDSSDETVSGTREKAKKPQSQPLSGDLSAMGLADLLQNLSQNRKSGILEIRSDQEGNLTMVDGQLVKAEVGPVTGTKAVYRMLGWSKGVFALLPLPSGFDVHQLEEKIEDGLESLLMEGFRQFDELEKIRKGLPPKKAKLRLKPKFAAPLSKLHPRVLDVLQIIINEGSHQAVLDHSPHTDLETSKIIFYLLKKDYIVAS